MRYILCFLTLFFPSALLAFPPVEQIKTPMGITLWYMGQHDLPVVAANLWVKGAGSFHEPEEASGLAQITAAMLMEGSQGKTAEEIQSRLDRTGTSIEAEGESHGLRFRMRALSKHAPEAFQTMAGMLNSPSMEEKDFKRVAEQYLAQWRSQQQDPSFVAGIAFWREAFPNHPCGRHASLTPESQTKVTLERIKGFLQASRARDRLEAVVVGALSRDEAIALVDGAFGSLPEKAAKALEAIPPASMAPAKHVEVALDTPQSSSFFGLPALPRSHQDFHALNILNHMLGSGNFSSRMMKLLREEHGLVYGAASEYFFDASCPALVGNFSTKTGNEKQAMDKLRQLLRDMAAGRMTAAEMNDARTNLLGSFELSADTSAKLAGLLAGMQSLAIPPEHLTRYREDYARVTVEAVQRVAAEWLKEERMVTVTATTSKR